MCNFIFHEYITCKHKFSETSYCSPTSCREIGRKPVVHGGRCPSCGGPDRDSEARLKAKWEATRALNEDLLSLPAPWEERRGRTSIKTRS